jgi:demethylmenaquinone methyltransferase/2-methoxy-6-polyprenyl-1,4-benzoquinol methylase
MKWMSESTTKRPLREITRRYDRVAPVYRALEPLFLIFPAARRKAVRALRLDRGDTVLEVGAGTGRNLPYLVDDVGPAGCAIALDASPGMLREARRLARRRGWRNVRILEQDAAHMELGRSVDAVLFSLSYSVIPQPREALARAWAGLRPGGRVVVMDAGLTTTRLRPILDPVARLLVRLGPGDPYSRPWEDLAEYGPVTTERFLLGIYFVCTITKPS